MKVAEAPAATSNVESESSGLAVQKGGSSGGEAGSAEKGMESEAVPPVSERKPARMAETSNEVRKVKKVHRKRRYAKKHRRKRYAAKTYRRKRGYVQAYRKKRYVKRSRSSRCACRYRRRCGKVRHYRHAANGGNYVVRRGDTLWGIAKRYYGNGSRYRRIYRANRGRIRNPHRIYVNQRIYLPSRRF